MAAEARGVIVDTVIDTAVALVTTAILTSTWAIARKRYKLLNQRDALLAEVQQTLLAVRDDNRCQYTALLTIVDAQELQLHALKGKKMNGNVDDALAKIDKARAEIQSHLVEAGCR